MRKLIEYRCKKNLFAQRKDGSKTQLFTKDKIYVLLRQTTNSLVFLADNGTNHYTGKEWAKEFELIFDEPKFEIL